MRIDPLTPLLDALRQVDPSAGTFHLSTESTAEPIVSALTGRASVMLFIGPEGGWTADELALFSTRNVRGLRLTATILRVETAAVAAAAVAGVVQSAPPTR